MIAAYRSASSYRDEGLFRAVLEREGEQTEDTAPMMVAWRKPNRIAVRAYQAAAVCDGRLLQARYLDEASGDLDGQVAERPIGDKLTLDDLFSDAVLREALGGRLGLHPLQLELLLAENPLKAFLDPQVEKTLLRTQEFDGRECYRVKVDLEGRYVFWIDREDFLLRRFEYPGDALLPGEEAEDAALTLAAEFPRARLNAELAPNQFSLAALEVAIPQDAKKVRFLVVPPQPLPTEMFGRKPTGYEFAALDGAQVTAETLAGKVAVLAWFSNHSGSQACLKSLDEVRKALEQDDRLAFFAVCTEPTSVSNDDLRRLAEQWGVGMPVVRDLGAFGRDRFDIRLAPSLVVLDARGAVQIHESGDNPQLAILVKDQLAGLLHRLAAGEDFAAAILTQAQSEREAYLLNLAAASVEGGANLDALTPAEVKPRTEPQRLRISQLWSNEEIDQPGNLVVLDDPQAPRLAVLDGGRAVVELDGGGKVLRRVELDLPQDATVTRLRKAIQGERPVAAAFAVLGPQAHVFDADWRRLLSYPPEDQKHDGVRDVLLADLDGSGTPQLLVGFWGDVGIQGVSLEGQRLWSNREMAPVLSLAPTPLDVVGWRKVLAAGDMGHLLRLNQYGNADPPIHVPQRTIHHLIAASWSEDRPTAYLGFSYAPEGNLVAIGLNARLEEMWSYRLPRGAYGNPLEFATPCRLGNGAGGHWLLAGPDGSIHLISDDGDSFDYFQTGQRLTGLAAFRFGENDVLAVASDKGLEAWTVQKSNPAP